MFDKIDRCGGGTFRWLNLRLAVLRFSRRRIYVVKIVVAVVIIIIVELEMLNLLLLPLI